MAEEARKRFPELVQVSYDKGFWNPNHLEKLEGFLDRAILPKKGKLSADDKRRESHPEFVRARRKHSSKANNTSTTAAMNSAGLESTPRKLNLPG